MLRACIIGTGRIASLLEKDPLRSKGNSHAGAYSLREDISLIAGADIDPQALQEFGDDWAIAPGHLYADYREMLARENAQIASVCAYAPQRLEMALAALESGVKGLWLEKALGCSLAEAEQIEAGLRERQAVGVVDYPRRGRAPYRKIKEIIDAESFGKLLSVTCHMTHQFIHTGTHAFDVIRYWCGEAVQVRGQLESGSNESGAIVDQGGSAEIAMSSGTRVFVSAYQKRYYIFQFDLIFEDARILIGNDIAKVYRPATSRLYTGYRELFEQESFDWGPGYPRDMASELIHCMKTGEEPLFSVKNAIDSLRIALAIFDSGRRGGSVVDPLTVDPSLRIENV